jgi:hypothetical protein
MSQRVWWIGGAVVVVCGLLLSLPDAEAAVKPPGCAFSFQTYSYVVRQQHAGIMPRSYPQQYVQRYAVSRPSISFQMPRIQMPQITMYQSFRPNISLPSYTKPIYGKPTYVKPPPPSFTLNKPTIHITPPKITMPSMTPKFTPLTFQSKVNSGLTHGKPGTTQSTVVNVQVATRCGSCHGCNRGGGNLGRPTLVHTPPAMPVHLAIQPVRPLVPPVALGYPMPAIRYPTPVVPRPIVPVRPTGDVVRRSGQPADPADPAVSSSTPTVQMPALPPLEDAALPASPSQVTEDRPVSAGLPAVEDRQSSALRERYRMALAASSPKSLFEPPPLPPLPEPAPQPPPLPELPHGKAKPGSPHLLPPPLPPG